MVAQSMQRNESLGFQRYGVLINQILLWAVFIYQAAAVLIFLAGLFLANRWFQQPFIGAFYEHTLVFNGTGSDLSDPAWALFGEVKVGDQLVAINEMPVQSSLEVREILSMRVPGENVTATVLKTNGEEQTFDITLYGFPESSRTVYFIVPSILGAIFMIVSLWIFGFRRNESAGRAFSLFTSSLAIVTGAYFNLITTHEFTIAWTLATGVAGGALINLALVFPVEPRFVINRPYLRWSGVAVGIVLAISAVPNLFNFNNPTAYIRSWQYLYGFVALSAVFTWQQIFIMRFMPNRQWLRLNPVPFLLVLYLHSFH